MSMEPLHYIFQHILCIVPCVIPITLKKMFGDTKYVFMGFCLDCDIAFECEHLQQYFMLKEK